MENNSRIPPVEIGAPKLYGMGTKPGPQRATLSVVPIELFVWDQEGNKILLGNATAFCDRWNGHSFLITNWHNITGRDPSSGQPKIADGVVPQFIRVHFLQKFVIEGGAQAFAPLSTYTVDFPIEYGELTKWIMHQEGQAIDIAAIALPDDERRYLVDINDAVGVYTPMLAVGSELFILGFPRGLKPVGNFPIWKRASIATEPRWMAKQERCYWVDSATREGMSGSPVVARALSEDDEKNLIGNGPLNKDTIISAIPGLAFVGVYSGRMGIADALEAQIGKVWRSETVQEMLDKPRPLDFDIK